jgi:L-amino acid N-acyltransferase YncA
MGAADVKIREQGQADWPAVLAILDEVAREGETYAMDVPATAEEGRAFWSGDHLAVAEVDGQLVGAAKMGRNRPAQGAHVGTASFIVAATARGRGVGRALGQYVVDWHRREGFRGIQFNAVVDSNTAAVRLWHSLGFESVGIVPRAFRRPSGEYVGLHVMYFDLTHDSSAT